MVERKTRKGGGGKLSRSETVTVRLDPVTRFAAELAAAKDRRTLSSFIEIATRDAAGKRIVSRDKDGSGISALQAAKEMWSPDRATCLFSLATNAPHLLSTEQQLLGEAIVYFLNEINILLSNNSLFVGEVEGVGGGSLFVPGHIMLSAFDDIEKTVSIDRIDRKAIKKIALREVSERILDQEIAATKNGGDDHG